MLHCPSTGPTRIRSTSIGDAAPERYERALDLVLADAGGDEGHVLLFHRR